MADPEDMIPLKLALGDSWPSDIVQFHGDSPVGDVLGKIGLVRIEVSAPACVSAFLKFRDELAFKLPAIASGNPNVEYNVVDVPRLDG